MKIFVTGDIHGNKALIHLALKILKQEQVDALIITGDIAPKGFYRLIKEDSEYKIRSVFPVKDELLIGKNKFELKKRLDLLGFVEQTRDSLNLSEMQSKQKEKLKEICKLLQSANIPVFMLIGNDDHILSSDWDKILKNFGILNLNLKTHKLDKPRPCAQGQGKWQITGFQYVLPTPWNTNNELPEEQLAKRLRTIEERVDRDTILVTHCPPKNILDRLTCGLCVGSTSIRKLIKDKQPAFHVFGHIHEAFGQKKIGNTLCYNVSCLWLDRILRGYVIDMDTKTIKKIEKQLSFKK